MVPTTNPNRPAIRPVPLKLFPTAGTLNEAVEIMQAMIPEELWNEVYKNLMIYHNTLLRVIDKQATSKEVTSTGLFTMITPE